MEARFESANAAHWLILIVVGGAVLRIVGLAYGLPGLFNADEPHIVDIAVSFGAGALNPHIFKYPTLFMYVLSALYGVFFLVWSRLGLAHSVREFAALFVWHPGAFFLLGRALSSVFSIVSVLVVFAAGSLLSKRIEAPLTAAGLVAVSPVVIDSAHAAKPESLMLLLAAVAWLFALRYRLSGRRAELVACGAALGLACSAQYTALPMLALVPVAWLTRRSSGPRVFAGAALAVAAGFLLGCPFSVLDFPAFAASLRDLHAMQGMVSGWSVHSFARVLWNILTFGGPIWVCTPLLVMGATTLGISDRKTAGLLIVPVGLLGLTLSLSGEGGWQRYLFAGFPALALIAGVGASWTFEAVGLRAGTFGAALALVFCVPGAWQSAAADRQLLLPDTRTLAARWIESHVAAGAAILVDQEHASPPLRLSRETVERLLEKTRASGHPKARYYEIMKESHPGGGYRLFQIKRSAEDLHTLPGHAEESAAGRPTLDVGSGLAAVRREDIRWIVLSSFGATPGRSPEVARFLEETEKHARLRMKFDPQAGQTAGPVIRIFELPPAGAS